MLKRKLSDRVSLANKKVPGNWSMGLYASADDPQLRVESDEKIVIIKDKYPKVCN
jgi:aprataxin